MFQVLYRESLNLSKCYKMVFHHISISNFHLFLITKLFNESSESTENYMTQDVTEDEVKDGCLLPKLQQTYREGESSSYLEILKRVYNSFLVHQPSNYFRPADTNYASLTLFHRYLKELANKTYIRFTFLYKNKTYQYYVTDKEFYPISFTYDFEQGIFSTYPCAITEPISPVSTDSTLTKPVLQSHFETETLESVHKIDELQQASESIHKIDVLQQACKELTDTLEVCNNTSISTSNQYPNSNLETVSNASESNNVYNTQVSNNSRSEKTKLSCSNKKTSRRKCNASLICKKSKSERTAAISTYEYVSRNILGISKYIEDICIAQADFYSKKREEYLQHAFDHKRLRLIHSNIINRFWQDISSVTNWTSVIHCTSSCTHCCNMNTHTAVDTCNLSCCKCCTQNAYTTLQSNIHL